MNMIRCDELIKLGYQFRNGDVVYAIDNKGSQSVTLGNKVGDFIWESRTNNNHQLKLNNSGWWLIEFTAK
jgi:hypothetical protein